jgi:hypothetical protein
VVPAASSARSTVYDELLRRRPELVDRLYEPSRSTVAMKGTAVPAGCPAIPCRWDGTRLRTFYHSDYFRSAARHADAPVGARERELFDVYEAIASEPGVYLDMQFEPGRRAARVEPRRAARADGSTRIGRSRSGNATCYGCG